jgi:hypothetical protein
MTRRLAPTEGMLAAWRSDPLYRAAYEAAEIFLDLVLRHASGAGGFEPVGRARLRGGGGARGRSRLN